MREAAVNDTWYVLCVTQLKICHSLIVTNTVFMLTCHLLAVSGLLQPLLHIYRVKCNAVYNRSSPKDSLTCVYADDIRCWMFHSMLSFPNNGVRCRHSISRASSASSIRIAVCSRLVLDRREPLLCWPSTNSAPLRSTSSRPLEA